jgi:hypothetical protein
MRNALLGSGEIAGIDPETVYEGPNPDAGEDVGFRRARCRNRAGDVWLLVQPNPVDDDGLRVSSKYPDWITLVVINGPEGPELAQAVAAAQSSGLDGQPLPEG